jgi:protein-disulfide reductase (glutathione)
VHPAPRNAGTTAPIAILTALLHGAAACGGDAAPAPNAAPAATKPAAKPADPPPPTRTATAPAHGFGDKIAWRGLEEGLREAAELGRPLMLVVHAAWCPRCKELRPRFFDPVLAETSERFVMVNVDQDVEREGLRYGPDGQYIPRVLFIGPTGEVDADLSNPGRSKYKYFYTAHDDLVGAMKRALDRHAPH